MTKKKHRFDFFKLEHDALTAWQKWDEEDNQDTRSKMFSKIQDLTYAVIYAGEFEKKYKVRLGEDPDATADDRIKWGAYEYTLYLFQRIVTRSKVFYPKQEVILLNAETPEEAEKLTKRLAKQPITINSVKKKFYQIDDPDTEKKHHTPNDATFFNEEEGAKQIKLQNKNTGQNGLNPVVEGFEVDYTFHKFALQPYINYNVRHVLLTKKPDYGMHELLETVDNELQNLPENPYDSSDLNSSSAAERFNKRHLAKKVIQSLKMFYPMDEIKRLFGITCEMIYNNDRKLLDESLPADMRDFATVLLGTAKRIAGENYGYTDFSKNKDYKVALKSAVRSSVFLASVVNEDFFDKSLLLATDMESLYRLATLAGGKTIQIPTLREMDTLLGAVSAITSCLLEGKDPDKAIREAKSNLGLVFSHKVNLKKFVYQAMKSYKIFGDEIAATQPLVNVLLTSLMCLEKVFDGMIEKTGSASAEEMAKIYSDMVGSCTQLTNSLVNTSNGVKDKIME
jgi:hypothetical protein